MHKIIFPIFLSFIIFLEGNTLKAASLNAEELIVSHKQGFYYSSFELVIQSAVKDVKIHYTLNGAHPLHSPNRIISDSPATILIDPESDAGRDHAPGVIVRACAVRNDSLFSTIVNRTFLFPSELTSLSRDNTKPGPGWPDQSSDGMVINYGLDPEIYNDALFAGQLDEAFLSIPSFSIITPLENLFHPDSGLYVHPAERGNDWEREISLELLNPDGQEGFQINCGLRIRGGASRDESNPKHAFRLFFRNEYGAGKLKYPLFGKEGIDEFDNIDLRTSQNYSWAWYGDDRNTFLRDIFSRDLQGEMGHPYTRSRFYHLYINGTYWGLYQTQERSEASFAESYFGDNREDYDVVKVDLEDFHIIEATDGNLDLWTELWEKCRLVEDNDALYYELQGLNIDETRNQNYSRLLDVDNLIDYMIITFFTGDFDGPVSNFLNNEKPNNFYAIINRSEPDGFKFFRHDAEHTLFDNEFGWGFDRTGPYPAGENFPESNPQYIHQKLSGNKNYRLRFGDRVYRHLFNSGSLTYQNNADRLLRRKSQIETAIIAESARWGDSKREVPLSKSDWQKEVDFILNEFLPERKEILLGQLISKELYVKNSAPDFNKFGGEVEKGFRVEITSLTDTVYYTTDGTDPKINEKQQKSSFIYSGPFTINSTVQINARAKSGNKWGIMSSPKFIINENLSGLKITEIHYHPLDEIVGQDTVSGKQFEFIELKNTGSTRIDLAGTAFTEGIRFDFYSPLIVMPGEFVVLVSDSVNFMGRHEFKPYGQFEGNLDNSGERIIFESALGDTLFNIRYNDKDPWPTKADGEGYSLVTKKRNPVSDPDSYEYWTASAEIHGSAGEDDLISGIHNNVIPESFRLEQNYPNPFNPATTIEFYIPFRVRTEIILYDILGRRIKTLLDKDMNSGRHKIQINFNELSSVFEISSGVYFCRISAGDFTAVRKMLFLK